MSKILLTSIQPFIDKNLLKNKMMLFKDITAYIDKNSEIIYDVGPVDRLFFSDEERSCVFKALLVAPNQIDEFLSKITEIDTKWENINNPFNIVCFMMLRFFDMKKMKAELELILMFWSLSIYSSKHKRSFPFVPNRNIMIYTINNLSKKFKIKQEGNLFNAIKVTAMQCHEYYHDLIMRANDDDFLYYINGHVTRIGHFVKNIADEFYKNHKSGNYLNLEEDIYSKEEKVITDNLSLTITRIADNATIQTLHKAPEENFIALASNMAEVSVNAVRIAIHNIQSKKNKELKELYVLILQLFLEDGARPVDAIGTKDFINYCYTIFAKSNTVNDVVLRIKDILDDWLKLCSPNYVKTNRVATKSNFRKAIYFYYVFMLQQSYNK